MKPAAGVAALMMLASAWMTAGSPATAGRTVAITIDDLPFIGYGLGLPRIQEETTRLLSVLKRHRVPTIGFVNEDKLEVAGEVASRVALLQAWLDAGMELGNHGYGHAVAPFTVEDSDYAFAKAYADARRAGSAALAEKVRDAYLDHQDAMFAFFEAESRDLSSPSTKRCGTRPTAAQTATPARSGRPGSTAGGPAAAGTYRRRCDGSRILPRGSSASWNPPRPRSPTRRG